MSDHNSHRAPGPSAAHYSYDRTTANDRIPEQPLARALGWFSLGIGATQIAAPGKVSSLIGIVPDDQWVTTQRALGVREIASGTGVLVQGNPTASMRARVAGDLMDLALLGAALRTRRRQPRAHPGRSRSRRRHHRP